MKISAKTKICMIIGDPVEHSLSPLMHNAGYEALDIDDQFVFTAAKVKPKDLKDVIKAVRAMNIRGLTCTIPHKIRVMKYLDEIDETAKKIVAVNTVVNNNGKLKGYNTDWLGVVKPLEKYGSLKGKKAAIIGAGGAAHAMVFGLLKKGASVVIFNRTLEKAWHLIKTLKIKNGRSVSLVSCYDLSHIQGVEDCDIILNATSLGMGKNVNKTPVPKKYLKKDHIVFDAVYVPYETRLLKEAKEKGARIIHGTEMLLYQGIVQFELYTGKKAPVKVMREILVESYKLPASTAGRRVTS